MATLLALARDTKTQPLIWLFATLLAYRLCLTIQQKTKGHPLANPVGMAILLLVGVLWLTGTDYRTYFEGGRFIHLLLGPATVALAVPLYANLPRLRQAFWPIMLTLGVGSVLGIVSSTGVAWWLGLDEVVARTLLSRSVSTPIAMGIASKVGGAPELAAVFVIVSGVFGAVVGLPILSRLGWGRDITYGFAAGLAAHGLGTARALQHSPTAGAFAGLAMGLNGLVTAILVPILLRLVAA